MTMDQLKGTSHGTSATRNGVRQPAGRASAEVAPTLLLDAGGLIRFMCGLDRV